MKLTNTIAGFIKFFCSLLVPDNSFTVFNEIQPILRNFYKFYEIL
jgi:hypothetical protein